MNKELLAVFVSIILAVGCAHRHSAPEVQKPHWSYVGETGPRAWADLDPEFAACRNGTRQSPVDLHHAAKKALPQIEFHYKPSNLVVVNNGHTYEADYRPGSSVVLDGKTYELVQFHFHSPSEHRLDGRLADMELHLVHQNRNGQLAVIGVLMNQGDHNPLIETIWQNLPAPHEKTVRDDLKLNAAALLPADRDYFLYDGSLTTPPCSEKVVWAVLRMPIHVSAKQLARFRKSYALNARPVQPLGDRTLMTSN